MCLSVVSVSGKREARAKIKVRCQQFYSAAHVTGNRHREFKCVEEMKDSAKSKKGNLVSD